MVNDRVGTVVELRDGQALVAAAGFIVAVLVGEPKITAARVELSVELLICDGDGNRVGELAIGETSA